MIIKLLISIVIGLVCGGLGAYSGAENTPKAIRRFGIPVLLTTFAGLYLWNLWGLALLLYAIPLIMGYGIPDEIEEHPSGLGSFWYNLIKKYKPPMPEIDVQNLASILTKGTIAKIITLISIVLPILKANWIIYAISSILIINVWMWLSWRGFGGIKLFNKYLTYSEIVSFGIIGLGVSLTILF